MEIDKDWEKFSGGPFVPYSQRIHVSLSRKGKLHINKKTYELLGKPQRVLLYFNRKKDQIGVRPAHERLADAFPIRRNGSSYCFYIAGFMRNYGIKLSTTEKFIAPEFNDNGLLALDLSQTVTVGGFKRKSRKC
jgi:hypothetical protein